MTVSSSIYQAQASWRQALVDAKRAARHVAQMQAQGDQMLIAERARIQDRRRAKFSYHWRLGMPGAMTGQNVDEVA